MARRLTDEELVDWIRLHAALEQLCDEGGWPDIDHATIEVCSREPGAWIVNITVIEAIRHISECEVTEYSRSGKYRVTADTSGQPQSIRLLYAM